MSVGVTHERVVDGLLYTLRHSAHHPQTSPWRRWLHPVSNVLAFLYFLATPGVCQQHFWGGMIKMWDKREPPRHREEACWKEYLLLQQVEGFSWKKCQVLMQNCAVWRHSKRLNHLNIKKSGHFWQVVKQRLVRGSAGRSRASVMYPAAASILIYTLNQDDETNQHAHDNQPHTRDGQTLAVNYALRYIH